MARRNRFLGTRIYARYNPPTNIATLPFATTSPRHLVSCFTKIAIVLFVSLCLFTRMCSRLL